MAKTASNLSAKDVNLLSNKVEGLSEIQQKIREQARLEMFATLNLDKKRFRDIASTITELHEMVDPNSTKKIKCNKSGKQVDYKTLQKMDPYKHIFEKYQGAGKDKEEKMHMEIAERIILNTGGAITYREDKEKGINKDFVEKEYNILNNEKDYKDKLDFFTIKDQEGNLYIIKRKDEEITKILTRENELKDEKIAELLKEKNNDEKKSQQEEANELKKKLEEDESKNNNEKPVEKIENLSYNERQIQLLEQNNATLKVQLQQMLGNIGGLVMVEGKELKVTKDLIDSTKKQINLNNKRIEELKGLKISNKKENNEDNENNEKEEFLRKMREYCPWLFEGQDKKEKTEKKEKNRKSVEENALYVSRHDVELSVAQCRRSSDYPQGTILIKGQSVKVEEFQFYEEMKQEYILAKGNIVKLQQLDREFAELAILCSPRGVTIEHRYQIRLTEEEIVAGGLVVNQTRLARYGLAVDFFEYTNTIIEREYEEKIETIRAIEEQIETLTRTVVELTTKMNIEKYSSEKIIEEIRIKKEKVRILKEKMYALLISLRKNGNGGNEKPDEDLLALKALEKRLMAELDELKKKKEHQEEVNKRIKELKEKMFDKTAWNGIRIKLKGLYADRISANRLLGKLDAEEKKLAEDEEKALKSLEPLASDYAPDEISKLTSEYYDIQKKHKAKLEEIEDVKNRIAEINKEIEKNSSYEKWQEIESALDAIPQDKKESIYLITKDGKKCHLQKNGDFFQVIQDPTKLFDNISSVNKEELLVALDPDYITKIVIGEKNIKETEILLGNSKEDEDELARLEAEQAGFDKDIDKKIADKEKELADVRKQIEEKESKNRKRVVVEKFDDGDKGIYFHDYCEKNGIKRKDEKEISLTGGLDPYAIYVDKDGRELRLEGIEGGSNDNGYDNPVAHYELVYYEEVKEKKRVVVEKFDDGDKGVYFHDYCEKNGIKRKDGKEISLTGGMDVDAIYVDKDGRKLKLEWITGASDDGYDNPVTYYELVYYEESEPAGEGTSEIEQELWVIIKEQEKLEIELTELEHKLKVEKSEYVKIEIEKQIKVIQEEITKLTKKITEITNTTRRYKEKITQYKYRVYRIRPIPIPPHFDEKFEMTSVISDMGTDVFREKASLKVEEKLKAYYKSLGRWQVGSRLALFLGRGRRRKRMIRREMNNMANTAFQTGAGYDTLNEQSQNAADRHGHELVTGMEAINKITTVHNQQVDDLCKDYLNNVVNDDQFQQQFNNIIAADANVQNALNGQSITHIGTNILLRLQEQKALNQLILDMDAQLAQYVATGNVVHMDNMRNYVSQYIKDYQKTPAFMANFEQFVKGDLNARNQLRQYLNHQKAVMQMQITNLRMNIDILNRGKSAYQIDNKDREQGKGSWKYKLGHLMDKHPRGTVIASTAISVGIGLGTGLIASPVLAGALSLGLFGGLVGTTNAVKKWTHHTKEQNTHEKNMVTDYRNEQAKIQAWQNQALNGHGRRRYKAKRQLALYDQTTQENIQMSDQITEYITNLSSKVGPLTADEDNFMRCNLIEGWARLKYYRQMGHNFLASEEVDKTEKDMKRLEKSITLGLQKIGKTTNDIETNMTATNQQNTNITYAVIQNDLKASYDKSLIQFKRERRNLSLKYGFGTAIASIGVGAFFQWITGSGIFAGKDIPATPGTPGTPESTTSYAGGTDNFALGGENISNGNVYNTTKSAISGSGAPTGSELTFNYGVGTDGTRVVSGFASGPKATALNADFANTALYPNLGADQVAALQAEATKITTDPMFVSAFKDAELARMRALEDLEHFARGLNDSARPDLILKFNHSGSIPGTTYNTMPERFMTGSIDITTPEIPGIPGDPGRKAVRRGRWFMGMPLFFNTWKDRKAKKDTTDQNFGRGSQQPRQPQPQPKQPNPNQPNPNQPHNP